MAAKIFISYRRDGTAPYAGRLRDALERRFAGEDVFIDLDMTPGHRFPEVIRAGVTEASAVIAVIGPEWLATLRRREARPDETDWVRFEVETALAADVMVVPVLVAGATMPARNDLPDALQGLADHQAVELSDVRWDYDFGRLADALETSLRLTRRARRRALRRRLAVGLAVIVVGAGAAAVAAALQEDPGPGRIDNRIESARLDPIRQTLGDFLTEQKLSTKGLSKEQRDEEGLIYRVSVRLQGTRGEKFRLRWRLYRAGGGVVAGRAYDQMLGEYTPENEDHARRAAFWLPYPPRAGRYTARFTLLDAKGKSVDDLTSDFRVGRVPSIED